MPKLEYPLKGIGTIPGIYLTQKFGQMLNDYTQFGLKGHNGIDWGAPFDTPIYAPHGGKLEFYGDGTAGYGFNARIYFDEDGFTWDMVFGHLHRYEGSPRQVKTGDVIGYVDSTGFSTGHHLHFGIRKLLNGAIVDYNNGYLGYIDPEPYFQKDTYQMIYKQLNNPTLYFAVGNTLIPFATDYTTYLEEFKDALVVELPPAEFQKFKVANKLKVKI